MTLAMASAACVNSIGVSPDQSHLDCHSKGFPAYSWMAAPRISFSRDYNTDSTTKKTTDPVHISKENTGDFEFRLDDPVAMLPAADELFSDGKLVPLDAAAVHTSAAPTTILEEDYCNGVESNEEERKPLPATCSNEAVLQQSPNTEVDPYLFSPKAPRCSSRWRELLGLKRAAKETSSSSSGNSSAKSTLNSTAPATSTSSSTTTNGSKSIRYFLQRNSKSSSNSNPATTSDSTLNLPLLRDSSEYYPESISSSRLSLSSSSSSSSSAGYDYVDDLPRLSLDSLTASKNRSNNLIQNRQHNTSLYRSSSGPNNYPRVRMIKPRMVQPISSTVENQKPLIDHPSAPTTTTSGNRMGRSSIRVADDAVMTRGVSVDSPRMISSGKIVFQGLERSSSSPSTFNGGPRYKHSTRPMDRSYSANVRVIAPVLNVPVGSFRGSSKSGGGGGVFGFFSSSSSTSTWQSQQKKDGNGGSGSSGGGGVKGQHHHHHYHQLVRR